MTEFISIGRHKREPPVNQGFCLKKKEESPQYHSAAASLVILVLKLLDL